MAVRAKAICIIERMVVLHPLLPRLAAQSHPDHCTPRVRRSASVLLAFRFTGMPRFRCSSFAPLLRASDGPVD